MVAFGDLAEIRFGCGLSDRHPRPTDAAQMVRGLTGPDAVLVRHPLDLRIEFGDMAQTMQASRVQMRSAQTQADRQAARKDLGAFRRALVAEQRRHARVIMSRWVDTSTGLRERLVHFWTDHFTVEARNNMWRLQVAVFSDEAIRPHVGGSFADMLMAASTHSAMVTYLDQARSAGPDSALAQANAARGLNENLGREILELHSLGVDGPYTQNDVRQMALMLTGLSHQMAEPVFRPRLAQTGSFELLGRRYHRDGGAEVLSDVFRDLTQHPATAQHIGRKLAVHFVSDQPEPELVQHVAARFADTRGDLAQTVAALLEHPAAWHPELANVKPPFAFIGSALRALATRDFDAASFLMGADQKSFRNTVLLPLRRMGQVWQAPGGPDGWPEADEAWVTPSGLAARARWAIQAPALLGAALPDPRQFVETALGSAASPSVLFAARAAETRADGVALVILSPAFQTC